jgi:hypothetical protein
MTRVDRALGNAVDVAIELFDGVALRIAALTKPTN